MQYFMPQYRDLARKALQKAGREDLIGFGKHALVPPRMEKAEMGAQEKRGDKRTRTQGKNGKAGKNRRSGAGTRR